MAFAIFAIEHNRKRELAKVLPIAKSTQAVAEVFNVSLLRLVHQDVPRVGPRRVVAELGDESCLRDVEMPAASCSLPSAPPRLEGAPIRIWRMKFAGNLQKSVERQGAGFLPQHSFMVSMRTT